VKTSHDRSVTARFTCGDGADEEDEDEDEEEEEDEEVGAGGYGKGCEAVGEVRTGVEVEGSC